MQPLDFENTQNNIVSSDQVTGLDGRKPITRFDLNLLSALDALLTGQSVTRAAQQLNVTQPTMSGMLQRLRYQFNDQLLVRNGRQMELTPFAASLVAPVREAIIGVEQLMRAEPVFDPATSTRAFKVMASDYCISIFLSRIAQKIGREAPGIRVIAQPIVDPVACLVAGTIDLCISPLDLSFVSQDYRHEKLQSEHLFSDNFIAIASAQHPISDIPSLEEFLSYPHVGVEIPGGLDTMDTVSLRQHAPDHKPNFVVPEYSLIGPMVADSELIGIVQKRLADMILSTSAVRLVPIPCTMPVIDEVMMWHTRHVEDPAHRWLRSLLREIASSQL